jgi:hypothetical protein
VIGARRFDWHLPQRGSTFNTDYRGGWLTTGGTLPTVIADDRSRYGGLVAQMNNKWANYAPQLLHNLGTRPWHIAALACTTVGSGNRQFLLGQANGAGGDASLFININDSNQWRCGVVTVTTGTQTITGSATGVTTRMQRVDLARLGNAFGFWVDGVSQGTLTDSNAMSTSAEAFAIGALGAFNSNYLGPTGVVWSGLIERVVIVTDAVAAIPGRSFDPYSPMPFLRGI